MILKRKKPRPPGIGSICKIKDEVLYKMFNDEQYSKRSVSYIKGMEGGVITRRSIRKNLSSNNEIMCADQTLVYISEPSLFNGIVKVIPLAIREDSRNGTGIQFALREKMTFLMTLDSLVFPNHQAYLDILDDYSDTVKSYIERLIQSEAHYNKPKFSWENKLI